jgi:hypothetical protein
MREELHGIGRGAVLVEFALVVAHAQVGQVRFVSGIHSGYKKRVPRGLRYASFGLLRPLLSHVILRSPESFTISNASCSRRIKSTPVCDEMAARLNAELAGKVVTVVALMDGGLFFVADLLRALELPVRMHTLSASSYQGGTATTGEVKVTLARRRRSA